MDPIKDSEKSPSAAAVGQDNVQSSTVDTASRGNDVPGNAGNQPDKRTQQRDEDEELDFHDTSDIEFHDRRELTDTNREPIEQVTLETLTNPAEKSKN